MQQRSRLAERLRTIGLGLLVVALLARLAIGFHVVGSDPSRSLLSWEGMKAVLSAYRSDAVSPAVRSVVIATAGPGMVLWLVGLALGLWRRPS